MQNEAITKLCGHTVTESLAGLGRNRHAAMSIAKNSFCHSCNSRLADLMSVTVDNPTVFHAQHLRGTPGRVSWANSLRSKAADRLAHVHAALMAEDSRLATGFNRLMMLLFSINDAVFWIESRNTLLEPYTLGLQAAHLLRSHYESAPDKKSICGYAFQMDGIHREACRDLTKLEQYFGGVVGQKSLRQAS